MKTVRCYVVALLAAAALVLPAARAADDEDAAVDEKVLKGAGLGADGPALLDFFRKRTLTEEDRKQFAALIQQLGADDFDKREEASRELIKRGTPVLPLLRQATRDKDAEISRRAAECVETLEKGPGTALPMAAARLLGKRAPDKAAPALLAYLPFADDSAVEQTVLDVLVNLAGRADTAAALKAALKDEAPVKRAAAAFVLGRSADKDVRAAVLPLLADKSERVRFRAAQGLLEAREKAAVPALIDLVADGPADGVDEVENTLARLAGEAAPDAAGGDDAAARKKRRDAWAKWWKDNGDKLDLAKALEAEPFLNLTVIPEMHANKVWECGKDGKPRWTIAKDLQCPIDAQVLPGGRILVAELNGGRVTERDRDGKILWEHKVDTPIYCQRLANGNTFISTNHKYCVVTRDGKEVMSYSPPEGNSFFMHSVQRLKNGHVVVVSMAGQIRELDAAGKEVRTITLETKGGWNGITGTPNGHYLVCGANVVQEIDPTGKKVWEYQAAGACYATRLPNGNTLVVSNGNSALTEVNKKGETVWSQKMDTSLWRSHRR
jgi:HEAT repeat protein